MNDRARSRKASVRDVRRTNRALVIRHLLFAHETSRSSAGEATALSAATITNLISDLIDEGAVVEQGFLESPGGRPRTVLGLNPKAAIFFGADVGETQITLEAFDLTLSRLGRRIHRFSGRRIDPQKVIDFLADGVASLIQEIAAKQSTGLANEPATEPAPRVLGLGLGVPGIVEHPTASVGLRGDEPLVHAQVVGWKAVTFTSLAERLGFPLFVDNGAKTTTQAEAWFGSAQGVEHGIVVLIGDGVGAGIITNGRLYRGSSSSAGEWGHTKISLDGIRCRCGSRGCVETFVGASAVLERWRGRDDTWVGRETAGIDALFAAFDAHEPDAAAAMSDLVDHLGLALANLVNLYNPQKIVVGGWFGDQIAEKFLEELHASVLRFSLEQPGNEVVLERSRLGHDAAALGAATLPLDHFIETGWPQ